MSKRTRHEEPVGEPADAMFRIWIGGVGVELIAGQALTEQQRAQVTSAEVMGATCICAGFFSGCVNLASVDMSEATMLTRIECDAFGQCHALESVIFPDGLETIGDRAFAHSNRLRDSVLPIGLRELGLDAFSGEVDDFTLYPHVICREAPPEGKCYHAIVEPYYNFDTFRGNPQHALLRLKLRAKAAGATEVFNVKWLEVKGGLLLTGSVRDP